jgi:poly-gamma-glutamate capsule biosynthesis protein CapA/YwtB (metallophosphatase superfamily)
MQKIFLAGDVMLGRGIDQILPHPGNPELYERNMAMATDYVTLAETRHGPIQRPVGYTYIWGDALSSLDRYAVNARIINLETAVTTSADPEPKGINYKMHPRNMAALNAFKVDCCVLANNHVLDWGQQGLLQTIESLGQCGIAAAGAGRNRAAAEAAAILWPAGGERVLVFSAAAVTSGVPEEWAARNHRPGVWLLDDLSIASAQTIVQRVAAVKRPGDIAVFSIHWGGNWGYEISQEEVAFAHALVDMANIDIVHGHSSHHPKAIEVYRGKLILYGCGDFLNDYEGIEGYEKFRGDLALGYIAEFDSSHGGRLMDLTLTPFQIRNFRLQQASQQDRLWLQNILTRECARFEAWLEPSGHHDLRLNWQ